MNVLDGWYAAKKNNVKFAFLVKLIELLQFMSISCASANLNTDQ